MGVLTELCLYIFEIYLYFSDYNNEGCHGLKCVAYSEKEPPFTDCARRRKLWKGKFKKRAMIAIANEMQFSVFNNYFYS